MSRDNRTSVLETRLDLRVVAGLARYYIEQHGADIRNKSELLRRIIGDYHDYLQMKAGLIPVEGTAQAVEILEALGLSYKSKGNRNNATLLKILDVEDRAKDSPAFDSMVEEALQELPSDE
jgi:hypothetical protein